MNQTTPNLVATLILNAGKLQGILDGMLKKFPKETPFIED